MNDFDWATVIGYQHEVVHTSLLEWMLNDPEIGYELARKLGLGEVSNIEAAREKKVPGCKGIADLVATFDGPENYEKRYLAVETKVDSNSMNKQQQLEKTLDSPPPGSRGVLLAVGVTHLCLTQDDLGNHLVEQGWRVIGPGDWADLLNELKIVDRVPALRAYSDRVRAEAFAHEEAIQLATSPEPTRRAADSNPITDGRQIDEFAWLLEVRREMQDNEISLPRELDRDKWFPYRNQSGPLMGVFPALWSKNLPHEAFLEFMCDWKGNRHLCLKLGGSEKIKMDLRSEAQQSAMNLAGMEPPGRRAGVNAKTCTVARLDLTSTPAAEAARQTVEVFKALEGELPQILLSQGS